ncbi:30S ribosomal protein S13 [bacterium]|nr:30S ribosomal protein S13 [bacterium]
MARIAGIDLPKGKRIEIGLTYLYGIGLSTSQEILKKTGINPDTKVQELTEKDISSLRTEIEKQLKVEGALKSEVTSNIKRLIETGSYRGTRHKSGLPLRGQRTRTNARTKKGPRKTIGTKKKEK